MSYKSYKVTERFDLERKQKFNIYIYKTLYLKKSFPVD